MRIETFLRIVCLVVLGLIGLYALALVFGAASPTVLIIALIVLLAVVVAFVALLRRGPPAATD
jgi:hypothetical protein